MEFLFNGVTAHRGNCELFPENTLPSFADGIAIGADWLELDVHLTADGELVVCHDADTGRTGDRGVAISGTSFADLREIDMAFAFRRERGLTYDDCPVSRIPHLSEVFDLVMRQDRTRVSLQPKADCVFQVAGLVRKMGAEKWIGFNDGSVEKMLAARAAFPAAHVFFDTGIPYVEEQVLAVAREGRFQSIVMHFSTVTAERVEAIRSAGFEPGAWTVNEMAEMRRLRAMGIERFYTDYPQRYLDLLVAEENL